MNRRNFLKALIAAPACASLATLIKPKEESEFRPVTIIYPSKDHFILNERMKRFESFYLSVDPPFREWKKYSV